MPRLTRLLLISFLESVGTILYERGIYFFCHERLGFTSSQNLLVAVLFGATYVVGALASHRVVVRVGEKRVLIATIVAQMLTLLAVALWPTGPMIFAGTVIIAVANGGKWPVVESYISAGRDARATAQAVGQFNIAWAAAVPAALLICGPLIQWRSGTHEGDAAIFVVALLMSLAAITLIPPLAKRPLHLALDHPARPSAEVLIALRILRRSARWTMFASYALLFILSPLVPAIFENLGYNVAASTALFAITDVVRVLAFVALGCTSWWHGRTAPLLACTLVLPVAFAMTLSGHSTLVVLIGEVLFGAASGLSYYAALYYAMLISNASVDAGGEHESLIGLGFFAGPMIALIGNQLGQRTGHPMLGVFFASMPLVLLCALGGLWPLLCARARGRRVDPHTLPELPM